MLCRNGASSRHCSSISGKERGEPQTGGLQDSARAFAQPKGAITRYTVTACLTRLNDDHPLYRRKGLGNIRIEK